MNPAWWSVAIGVLTLAIALGLQARGSGRTTATLEQRDGAQQKEIEELKANHRRAVDHLWEECRQLRRAGDQLAAVPALLALVQERVEGLDAKVDRLLERRGEPRGAH